MPNLLGCQSLSLCADAEWDFTFFKDVTVGLKFRPAEQCANDEATQKDWCSTELSKNEQARTTLADDVSNLKHQNDVHVAKIFSPPRATAESHCFGLSPGMVFDIKTGWNLEDPMDTFCCPRAD